ncbi:MAG TPA: ester cyclase, partial [Polyangia bacterium]|nr:ester cyclase [Polyangia bacterium]
MQNDLRNLITRYFEDLWNRGDASLIDELLHPDYVNHSPGSPTMATDRTGVAWVLGALRTAFPDLRYVIEDMVVGDDAVAVRTTMTGTHRGDFFGLAPTGRAVRVNQMNFERFRDGRIVSHHRVTDMA